jgi:hypothetical protein
MTPGTLVVVMALMWAAMLVVLFRLLGSMEQTERDVVALDPPRRGSGRQRRG